MHWQYTVYLWLYIVAALLGCGIGAYAWRHRNIPAATPFAIVQFASALWALANGMECVRSDLSSILFFDNIAFIGIGTLAPATLAIALEYTGSNQWLTKRVIALLAFVPTVTVVLSWTDGFLGLGWVRHTASLKAVGTLKTLTMTPGPWYWVHTAYAYTLLLAALVILLMALRQSPHRGQLLVLISGLLIMFVGNVARHLGLMPTPFHLSSIFSVPAGLTFMFGLFRYKLFDIAPVARSIIFDNLCESVVVLDAENRIVDLNPSARKLFGKPALDAIGKSARVLFAGRRDLLERYRKAMDARDEIVVDQNEKRLFFDLRISPMQDARGRLAGRLVVLNDITARKQVEEELRQAKLAAESATRA
ncbi:MAG TPA: histidine kinase N-terminal 7TM domain-containing protein, partial [Blastocatellia bacterium]